MASHLKLLDSLIDKINANDDDEKQIDTTNKQRVLYIFPLARDYTAIKTLPKSISNLYEFHFIDSEYFSYSSKASSEFSMIQFIDKCIAKVQDSRIDIVISTRDMADLVHAVLATKFAHIKGPHFISSFVTLYKPYTKLFIDTDNPINFELVNVAASKKSEWSKERITHLLKKLNFRG